MTTNSKSKVLDELKMRIEEKLNTNDEGIRFRVSGLEAFEVEEERLTGFIYGLSVEANRRFDRYPVVKAVAETMVESGVEIYVDKYGITIVRERGKTLLGQPVYHQLYCSDGLIFMYNKRRTSVFADGTFSYYVEQEEGVLYLKHCANEHYKEELILVKVE